jgi:rhodanese-related sulfurtransferase
MKYIFGIIISLVVLAGFLLVWNGNLIKEGSNMSNDVVDMVRSDEDIILIDVRTPQEYRERRIPGSILLPDYEIRDRAADVIPDKDARIVVYCRSGRRSAQSAHVLRDMGYENVYDLGGINSWPHETISGD